jgi:hypothetical protein
MVTATVAKMDTVVTVIQRATQIVFMVAAAGTAMVAMVVVEAVATNT